MEDEPKTKKQFIAELVTLCQWIAESGTSKVEWEQTVEALWESEARYRNLFANSALGIYRTTPDGQILAANPALVQMLGYSSFKELSRWNLQAEGFELGYERSVFKERIEREGQIVGLESVWTRRDGTSVFVRENAKVIHDENGNALYYDGTVEDITERKRAEEELQKYQEHLEELVEERTIELYERIAEVEQLNRRTVETTRQLQEANAELESFAYSVSHDLRAPLRHIDGFVQLFLKREEGKLDPTSLRYLNIVAESSDKMSLLIDNLLAFSRTGQAEMQIQRVELDKLVRSVQQELAPSLEGRRIHWEVDPLPSVEADPVLLRRVWVNLFSNAIKFTAPRPKARIEIGTAQRDADDTDEIILFVRDNGVGFDPQYTHKLFGVFQRLHLEDEFEGAGIGLAIVRRIIHRHGGRVWVEGKLNCGATFYFTLKEARGE